MNCTGRKSKHRASNPPSDGDSEAAAEAKANPSCFLRQPVLGIFRMTSEEKKKTKGWKMKPKETHTERVR